jgi:imidazolonepropionase-like amidohydrolase
VSAGALPARGIRPLVISGVTVIAMDGRRPVRDRSVLIDGGVIRAIAAAGELESAGADVLPAHGRYLLPGLADMHVHYWEPWDHALYLASGVTLVRNMAGAAFHLAMARRVLQGLEPGPHVVTASPLIDGIGDDGETIWPNVQLLVQPEKAERLVERYAGEGYQQIKAYSWLRLDVLAALGRAAASRGLRLTGHCPEGVSYEQAMDAGLSCFEHLAGIEVGHMADGQRPAVRRRLDAASWSRHGLRAWVGQVDLAAIRGLAGRMAAAQVWNCPTLALAHAASRRPAEALADPRLRYVPPATVAAWASPPDLDEWLDLRRRRLDTLRDVVSVLHAEGAPLLAGTDASNPFVLPGFSLHRELEELVAAGLSPHDALRCATSEAARFLGQSAQWGTVAVGRRAELLLLRADPLHDLRTLREPEAVFVNGYHLARPDLDRLLQARAAWARPASCQPPLMARST